MTQRNLWVYWEMAPGVRSLPPHIAICRKIMEKRAVGYRLNVVTPENVRTFLPELPDRLDKIALNPKGRIEKFFGRGARRAAAIAQRADYIRAFLLERHGGIYIDSDAVIVGDLVPMFEEVERIGFMICRRSSFGKKHVSVNFYGSVAGGQIIREYAEALRSRLSKNLSYDWNEVGASMLTPIVDSHIKKVSIIPEKIIQPVTFEEADQKFASTALELGEVVAKETKIFMLYNGPFKGSLAGLSEEELINSQRLISKVFQYALSSPAFSGAI